MFFLYCCNGYLCPYITQHHKITEIVVFSVHTQLFKRDSSESGSIDSAIILNYSDPLNCYRNLRTIGSEGMASHYEQRTKFGMNWLCRNTRLAEMPQVSVLPDCQLKWPAGRLSS